jgi:hypothetical protein
MKLSERLLDLWLAFGLVGAVVGFAAPFIILMYAIYRMLL